ncbi:MAG: hypothetical protein M3Y09_04875 [Actinomycetota bacterium]|nr:hypothetical protein [Actinomycetota bacterium]
MAFGSKFLYFADPHGRALILDALVRAWLTEHAGIRLRGGRDEREYAMWLLIVEQWAKALKLTSEQIELLMFTDALPHDSLWRPQGPGMSTDRLRRLGGQNQDGFADDAGGAARLRKAQARGSRAGEGPVRLAAVERQARVRGSRRLPVVDPQCQVRPSGSRAVGCSLQRCSR